MADDLNDDQQPSSTSGHISIPLDKDAAKKDALNKQKTVLEAEQRALQTTLLQLRNQQRELLLENNQLKRIWQYRERVKAGEIEDPEVRYGLEMENKKGKIKF